MNTTIKVILFVIGGLFLLTLVLGVGFFFGRFGFQPFYQAMPMHWFDGSRSGGLFDRWTGPGMMWDYSDSQGRFGDCQNDWGYQMGPGMMGGWDRSDSFCGDFEGRGPGRMWDFNSLSGSSVKPISVEQAEDAVNDFLVSFGDENLILAEVMVFDNHAYAEIIEEDSGVGAMEVLIDPDTLGVYPEHGPNMMWNEKYNQMGRGMMGGRLGRYNRYSAGSDTMSVSPEEAVEAAQEYLDRYESGLEVTDHADPFYGYYTLHTVRDGEIEGMLSVNGYTGAVFIHTWHGDFIEMQEFVEESHD